MSSPSSSFAAVLNRFHCDYTLDLFDASSKYTNVASLKFRSKLQFHAVLMLCVLCCSCCACCAGELSAVETSLLQAVRTLFVWIINLLIYVTASALAPDSADQLEPLTPMPGYNSTALAAAAAVGLAAGTGGSSSSTLYSPSGSSGSATASLLQQKQWPQLLRKAIAVPLQSLQLHQHLSGGATAAVSDSSSSSFLAAVGLAAASEEYSNALNAFPGEPWLSWSFLQAAGFVILVIGKWPGYNRDMRLVQYITREGLAVDARLLLC